MSNQIQLQSDIGALSIHGLGAFSKVLAVLSADNISPMALIQIEKLGGCFPVNGKFADQVPDLLTRFSTQPLGRLAAAVGWRKGDTASLLAGSAGGQSVGLLLVVLANLFKSFECGEILSRLCSRLVPKEFSTASISQLAEIVRTVSQKLFMLGFGNFLPKEVLKVYQAYCSLKIEPPVDLLDSLTVDAIVDLLDAISQALDDEAKITRISGCVGMGHIMGILLFMFPHDTVITVEDIVIHAGQRASLYVELRREPPGPATVTVESKVNELGLFQSPIKIQTTTSIYRHQLQFTWQGWIARCMELAFLEVGSVCTEETRTALCNLMVAVMNVEITNTSLLTGDGDEGDKGDEDYGYEDTIGRLVNLLGPHAHIKMEHICHDVLLVTPTSYKLDLRTAFDIFIERVEDAVDVAKICQCAPNQCSIPQIWDDLIVRGEIGLCRFKDFWFRMINLINAGTMSFFINARSTTAPRPHTYRMRNTALEIITSSIFGNHRFISAQNVYGDIMSTIHPCPTSHLAISWGSTIYPTSLETMELGPDSLCSFELLDGRIIFKERYCDQINSMICPRRLPEASTMELQDGLQPSSTGQHRNLLMTIREKASGPEFQTTVEYSGTFVHLTLPEIIQASFALTRTSPCSHPSTTPVKDTSHEVALTSVAAPLSLNENAISVVMTQSNPTAQLLSCERGARMLLMKDCCLGCALEQAAVGRFNMIIVT